MRVLAIAQLADALEAQVEQRRWTGFGLHRTASFMMRRQPLADLTVIGGGVGEGSRGQCPPALRTGCVRQRRDQGRIVVRTAQHGDALVVLGRRAQQRRPANIDVLDRIVERAARLCDGLGKRIQIDHHQIDQRQIMRPGGAVIDAGTRQNAAVNARVERLDASAHDLRKPGMRRDLDHRNTLFDQCPESASGRQDLDPGLGQGAAQLEQTALVGNAEQRPTDDRYRGAHRA